MQTRRSSSMARCYLVITNISKRQNVKNLLQTAAAFDCDGVFVVGQRSFDWSPDGPDLPTVLKEPVRAGFFKIERYAKWEEFTILLKEQKIRLVGVEIHVDAKPIETFLDQVDTAFIMGNEGTGLSEKQMKSCDAFVRIPQYGGGTASLNVYVAASIILHRYYQWQQKQVGGKSSETGTV